MTLNSATSSMSDHASAIEEARSTQSCSDLAFSGQGRMPRIEYRAASKNDVHDINVLLGAIVIGAQANVQWLKSTAPNVEAAQLTSARLLAQIQNLCEMVDGLRSGRA